MAINLTEHTITAAVQQTVDTSTDDRFRGLMVALVAHLHDFAREVRLTGDEWFTAIDFLQRVGKIATRCPPTGRAGRSCAPRTAP